MAYSQMFETMWLNLWGNSLIGAIAILAAFAYLCFKKKLDLAETFIVVFPVMIGVTTVGCFGNTTGCIPSYISGSVVMMIGALWGLALSKAFNTWETFVRIYCIYICIQMSLMLYGYPMGEIILTTSGEPLNTIADAYSIEGIKWGITSVLYFVLDLINIPLNFMLGGAITGIFTVSGLPSDIIRFITVPIQLISFVVSIAFLSVVWNTFSPILTNTIGGITKLIRF